jgi:hypothetical protein
MQWVLVLIFKLKSTTNSYGRTLPPFMNFYFPLDLAIPQFEYGNNVIEPDFGLSQLASNRTETIHGALGEKIWCWSCRLPKGNTTCYDVFLSVYEFQSHLLSEHNLLIPITSTILEQFTQDSQLIYATSTVKTESHGAATSFTQRRWSRAIETLPQGASVMITVAKSISLKFVSSAATAEDPSPDKVA